jgi:hypothetical protein
MDRAPAYVLALSKIARQLATFAHSSGVRKRVTILAGAIVIAGLGTPAMAASGTSTQVVRCGEQSCLQVSGYRDDPASSVSINGQAVAVEGKHSWKVRVPVDTLRGWSAPYARTIEVSLRDPQTQLDASASVDLPIGLLGNLTDLSALEIRAR